jgi:hypothetical protein
MTKKDKISAPYIGLISFKKAIIPISAFKISQKTTTTLK